MAAALFDAGRNAFAQGGIVWKASGGSTIKCALLSSGYTVNLTTHANLSDITGGAIVATSAALTLTDSSAGTCDASDVTFSSVTSGSTVTQFILYKDTGTASTSTLISHDDAATGLPVTTNGGDITITWPAGGIFTL